MEYRELVEKSSDLYFVEEFVPPSGSLHPQGSCHTNHYL